MKAAIWTANTLGWPVIQLGIAAWMIRRPGDRFAHESWITRSRPWEARGVLYRRLLAIQHWKYLLPSGAKLLGGVRQEDLLAQRRYAELLAETRRAELAHWYMLLCTPVFFYWNPWWASLIMLAYGLVSNLPCILNQRFTRVRLRRLAAFADVPS